MNLSKGRNSTKDKHERILRAAIKVFAKNGFHNSKISQIAKEAGVADGTIYLYFKNKDDILIKLFEERLDDVNNRFQEVLDGIADPEEKLRTFIAMHIELMDQNRHLAEVISVELRQSHKFMKEYVPRKFAEYLNVISRIIREGKDRGVFRADAHPGVVKRMLFGALDELVLYSVLSPSPKYEFKTLAQQATDLFIRGLKN
ncbi:MAG: TetR/AcrR family transcriptional regulator [Myxococcales bacterium]|nr:TetR/AcrR family transcriptional regulator [Myxococcales bacterium]